MTTTLVAADVGRTGHPVVASIPADHVYIRHLSPEGGGGARRLPDPQPDGSDRSTQQRWWPPRMLDPDWVARQEFDLIHVHFGFDARSPRDLERFVGAAHRRGRPVVFTVHDLRNPHHRTRAAHDAQLDVLVPAADQLVTLTSGAAAEIAARWGREAVVLPHPHVVALTAMPFHQARRRHREGAPFRVGLHLKSVRASMDPLTVLPVLVEAVGALPGGVLQLNAHHELATATGACHDPDVTRALRAVADLAHVDVRVHDYQSDDDAFFDYLGGLDVSVLPYRFGTHSGWLEACRDVGTTVVAPTCGYYAEQGPVLSFVMDEERFDADSLVHAVATAHDERPDLGATVAERRRQRASVADGHERIYRSVLEAG